MSTLQQLRSSISQIKDAASREFEVSSEDLSKAMFEARESRGQSANAPRGRAVMQTYRTPQAVKAALGFRPDSSFAKARKKVGIDFDVSTLPKKIGTVLGSVGADVTLDRGRSIYWLLNAAQATGDVIAEEAIARARPELYQTAGKTKRRKFGANSVQLVAAPAGFAINTGLGLMTPFGGAEGYKAALPSADDPSKTSNVVGEIAAKYILGRTGDLLPYDEFVKVRPDVSKDEYQRYKAFKFDKREDYNPFDDGDVSLLMGAARFTDEGIHGPEIQFLGRSLPITTGVVPFVGATAGAALGVSKRGPAKGVMGYDKPIHRGIGGSVAGLLTGNVVGNLIEGERRRRNAADNKRDKL